VRSELMVEALSDVGRGTLEEMVAAWIGASVPPKKISQVCGCCLLIFEIG
jgi:hypothetical protein